MRLLVHDQLRVTAAFRLWNATEQIRTHTTLGPVIATVYRRLQRDLDRLYVLLTSYHSLDDLKEAMSKEQTTPPKPTSDAPPALDCTKIFQRAYRKLERLNTRYAALYTAATAVVSPPIRNIAYSNQQGIRELMDDLAAAWLLATIQQKTDGLRSLPATPAIDATVPALPRPTRPPKTGLKNDGSWRSPNR